MKNKKDYINPDLIEVEEDKDREFNSFFEELKDRVPDKVADTFAAAVEKSRSQGEKIAEIQRNQISGTLDEFVGVMDQQKREKAGKIIKSATIFSAIVGLTPIPFADAMLLVPIQLTMMARLHKLFGQSWTQGISKSVTKEITVVTFGRSAVGNLMKFIPAVGSVGGAIVNGTVASTITASVGWVTVKMLNGGEDLFDNMSSFKGQYSTLSKAIKKVSGKA